MAAYVARRVLVMIPTLLLLSVLTFYAMHLVPGDTVDVLVAQSEISPEKLVELKRLFGLDRPIHVQYFDWFRAVVRGDWGHSLRTGRPILEDIVARTPVTYELTMLALAFGLALGIPAGIVSAVLQNTRMDVLARFAALLGLSIPHFWLATMIILVLSKYFGWLPPIGFVSFLEDPARNLLGLIFPAIALSTGLAADTARMLRSSLLDVYSQEYIWTARAKGLNERGVAIAHALRNGMIPVISIIAVRTGYLLAGAVIVEEIFSVPGMGRLLYNAVFQRDYPMVQACVLVIAVTFAFSNLMADILYAYLDPRIRYG